MSDQHAPFSHADRARHHAGQTARRLGLDPEKHAAFTAAASEHPHVQAVFAVAAKGGPTEAEEGDEMLMHGVGTFHDFVEADMDGLRARGVKPSNKLSIVRDTLNNLIEDLSP